VQVLTGKAAPQIILCGTEVSSEEDDIPLQTRMRSFYSGGPTVSEPLLSGQEAPRAATTPRPDPRVAMSTGPDGSGGSVSTLIAREVSAAVAATEKAAKMRMAEESAAVKAAEEAVVVKVATDKVTAAQVAADKSPVVKTVTDEAAMETADQGAVGAKATMESTGFGSSPALVIGTMRAAVSDGSTPPFKRIRCAWKPRYAEQLCSCLLLFIYLY
jgi:hypothetical protein